jgi:hypothetical protein
VRTHESGTGGNLLAPLSYFGVPNGSTIPERHPHAQLRVIVNWCYIAISLIINFTCALLTVESDWLNRGRADFGNRLTFLQHGFLHRGRDVDRVN